MFSRQVSVIGLVGWVCLVLVHPGHSRAEGNLRIGSLEIHPAVSLVERFEDNVCRTKSKECFFNLAPSDGRDSITVLSPALLIRLPIRDHRIETEVHAEIARYHTLKTENYEDNSVRGSVELDFPVGIQFKLDDQWTDGHEARQADQNSEMDLFRKNVFQTNLKMKVGVRVKTEIRYSNMTIGYDEDRNGFRNRREGLLGGRSVLCVSTQDHIFTGA